MKVLAIKIITDFLFRFTLCVMSLMNMNNKLYTETTNLVKYYLMFTHKCVAYMTPFKRFLNYFPNVAIIISMMEMVLFT